MEKGLLQKADPRQKNTADFQSLDMFFRLEEVNLPLLSSALAEPPSHGVRCEHVAVHISARGSITRVCDIDGAGIAISAAGCLRILRLSLLACLSFLSSLLDANLAISLLGCEDGKFLSEENVFGLLGVVENDGVGYLEIETKTCVARCLENHHMGGQGSGNQGQAILEAREISVGIGEVATGGRALIVSVSPSEFSILEVRAKFKGEWSDISKRGLKEGEV